LVQKQEGWVSEPAIRAVAELLWRAGDPRAGGGDLLHDVHAGAGGHARAGAGVRHDALPDARVRGADGGLQARIGPQNHRRADGKFYWQEVECMGACANAPMAAINDRLLRGPDAGGFEKLLDAFAAGKTPKPGSEIGRQGSAPEGGPTTLTDPKLFDGSLAKKIKIPNLPSKVPA
jgi:NADH-quinone oxidoreductase subunit E